MIRQYSVTTQKIKYFHILPKTAYLKIGTSIIQTLQHQCYHAHYPKIIIYLLKIHNYSKINELG